MSTPEPRHSHGDESQEHHDGVEDIVHAIPLTIFAGTGHLLLGNVNLVLLGQLLLGSVPGIVIGSLLAGKLPERGLRFAIAAVLVIAAFKLLS